MERRVVVTGMGQISPLGISLDSLMAGIRAGRSGVRELRRVPSSLPVRYGGEAWDFTGAIDEYGELERKQKQKIKKGTRMMCREIEMGVASAQLAIQNSNLQPGTLPPERCGVIYGTDYIMTQPDEFISGIRNCVAQIGQYQFTDWAQLGLPNVQPKWLLKYLPNMPASHLAIYNDFRGPNNSLTMREAAANLAVWESLRTIQRGSADLMVAGATGTRIHPLRSVHAILQESTAEPEDEPARMSRPFDRTRTGMVLGEGAAAMVLEELSSAEQRGAPIYAEVVAGASSAVARLGQRPHLRQAIGNVVAGCLQAANWTTDEVGHIHAHGVGTVWGDQAEAEAIHDIFDGVSVPVTAAKSYFGNLGAGSGMVEAISSTLALKDELFPILNYANPDPNCPIHGVAEPSSPGDRFISISVSPQGQASAIAVQRYPA